MLRAVLLVVLVASGSPALAAPAWAETGSGRPPSITHGPDPAPPGVDLDERARLIEENGGAPEEPVTVYSQAPGVTPTYAAAAVPCTGDGVSGNRVQAVYAHPPGTDRYATYLADIREWAAAADDVIATSAAQTGGVRHVNWVTNANCQLDVINLELPLSAIQSTGPGGFDFAIMESAVAQVLDRPDRKYLIWTDANQICGIAGIYLDDSPGTDNINNGAYATYARVDRGCWGLATAGVDRSVEAHELMHMLGAVQDSAPHSDGNGHTVECDLMYWTTCSGSHSGLADKGHDDYFHTAPTSGYLTGHWNTANSSFLNAGTQAIDRMGRFHPLTPARILDTRFGVGLSGAQGQAVRSVQVTGRGGVPASGVSAVVLNVTATEPSAWSHLRVWPAGGGMPNVSNVNYVAGQTVPNLVTVKVGSGGKVSLYNNSGLTHVIFDVAGWYSDGSAAYTPAGRYQPLAPARILDTRYGTGGISGPVGASPAKVKVWGRGGVPSGATAVVMNVTVTEPTAWSHLRVYPTGTGAPDVSNLNYLAGETIPNLVVVKVGSDGYVNVTNNSGSAHVIVDVAGWFGSGDESPAAQGRFEALDPVRLLDTRLTGQKLQGGQLYAFGVLGVGGVPASGVSAVVLNVTVTEPTAGSHLTLFPSGSSPPNSSNLNFEAGETIPNQVIVKVGPDGAVGIRNNSGWAHVIFDVAGYYATGS